MKPSEYLKSKCSTETYFMTWGTGEKIPKEMDELFISKDDIRSQLTLHHKTCFEGCLWMRTKDKYQKVSDVCTCDVCVEIEQLLGGKQ